MGDIWKKSIFLCFSNNRFYKGSILSYTAPTNTKRIFLENALYFILACHQKPTLQSTTDYFNATKSYIYMNRVVTFWDDFLP